MQVRSVAIRKTVNQLLFWLLLGAAGLQLLTIASDEQFVTNLAKPKLGAFSIGPWHSTLSYGMYSTFSWLVVIALGLSIVMATYQNYRRVLVGIGFGIFMVGSLFGNTISNIESRLWVAGLALCATCLLLTMLAEHVGFYRRHSAPTDASELTHPTRVTAHEH